MARPKTNRFAVVNTATNTVNLVPTFAEAVAVFSPDNPMPDGLRLDGISPDGSVAVAILGDWRVIRL